jgi:DNA polymerase
VPIGKFSVEYIQDLMGQPIYWEPGLPLREDAFETDYYKKD